MAEIAIPIEKWASKVNEVVLGGGSRKTVTVGGEATLPFLHFEGSMPNRPVIAIDIEDQPPEDWSPVLNDVWGEAMQAGPGTWAQKAVEAGADLVALTLRSADPNGQNTGPSGYRTAPGPRRVSATLRIWAESGSSSRALRISAAPS